jgi:hypothetical protein
MRISQANLIPAPSAPPFAIQSIMFSSNSQKFNRNIPKYPYIRDPVKPPHAVR